MIEDVGVNSQSVGDKLIVEILRGASLEDNEDLHTRWAALLANAASRESIFEGAQVEVTEEKEFQRCGLDLDQLSQDEGEQSTPNTTFEGCFERSVDRRRSEHG